ncbi:MAG: hypothetical protein ACRDTD_22235, partial [Pseudonocardiaceae bacterium]
MSSHNHHHREHHHNPGHHSNGHQGKGKHWRRRATITAVTASFGAAAFTGLGAVSAHAATEVPSANDFCQSGETGTFNGDTVTCAITYN